MFVSSKVHVKLGWLALSIIAIINGFYVYFFMPSRNTLSILLNSTMEGFVYLLILNALLFKASFSSIRKKRKEENQKTDNFMGYSVMVLVVLGLIGGIGLLNSKINVKPVWNSINKTTSTSKQAPTFKKGQTPVALPVTTVLNRVRKAMSEVPNNQWYKVSDDVQAQYYHNKPVYVVPVEYQSFWAALKAKKIPGYFMIDATNPSATPRFIKKEINYSNSAYFNHLTERRIYNRYPSWLRANGSQPQLEIDDHGTPYWVETMYRPKFASLRVDYRTLRVAVLNATNGEVKLYKIKDLPAFIDEGITSDVASELNHIYGYYVNGFFNTLFSKTGVQNPTGDRKDNVVSVFNKNGTISYFTDFTNPNNHADSTTGYSMINARTGALTYYKTSGVMDSSGAVENADQNYKAQKWHARMPILYSINQRPVWVMTILDKTGAVRGYYYLDAADQSINGAGNTVASAVEAFRQSLVNQGKAAGNLPGSKKVKLSGKVDRLTVLAATHTVVFNLEGSTTIYTVDSNDFPTANLTHPGDQVQFTAQIVKQESLGNISAFKNVSFGK